MHLQRFILSGLIAGAALFLPANVFADKADRALKQPVVNEVTTNAAVAAQKQVNEKSNSRSLKSVSGNEKNGPHTQVEVEKQSIIQKEPSASQSSQLSAAKPAQLKKALPEQASNRAEEAVQKAVEKIDQQAGKKLIPEKAMTNPGKKKGLTEKENQPAQQPGPIKNNEPIKPVVTEQPSEQPVQRIEPEEEPKRQVSDAAPSLNEIKETPAHAVKNETVHTAKEELVNKVKDKPALNRESKGSALLIFNGSQNGSHPSGTDKSIPHEKQAATPAQPNQQSGGASKDRTNKDRTKLGYGSVNYADKWLDWGHYWELELSQSYMSRIKELSSQWTNAPPSQPPRSFLFLTIQNQKIDK